MHETLKRNTATLQNEVEQRETAAADERSAAAGLLAQVLEVAKPTLRAIGDHLVSESSSITAASDDPRIKRSSERYIALSSDDLVPYARNNIGDEFRGMYHGRKLAVRDDGVLCAVEFEGNYSRWQGGTCFYVARVSTYADCQAAVNDRWVDVEAYVRRLAVRVEKAIGGRIKGTDRSKSRAAKLRAAMVLLSK